ncbi:hypothetical protein GCM10022408_37890 [Hymenobacter fastidiosus]|uniref:Uncharacterized protein n=1 Tax=Hymenobacter fastidiosus TaxID=486264 RepID=A0ABP7T2Y2_9BACT
MPDKSVFDAFTAFQGKPHVTAAMIGISCRHWTACEAGQTAEHALEKMRDYRFDVLPVQEPDGQVSGYFRTRKMGDFGQLPTWCGIDEQLDCLDYKTGIFPLLKQLADSRNKDRAPFYFLTAPGSQGPPEIVGMVSDINLNSRAVFQYGYAALTELEMELSELIGAAFPEEKRLRQALDYLAQRGIAQQSIESSLQSFTNDSSDEHQNTLREYLTLRGMLALVEHTGLYSWLGYSATNAAEFGRKRTEILSVRNWIAHPVHSYEKRPRKPGAGNLAGDTKPDLLATRLYTAFSAVDTMVRSLKELRKKVDLRTDRPRVGQYFTSRFFSVSQARDAFREGTFMLEPGVAAPEELPSAARSIAYVTPQNPEPKAGSWQTVDSTENQDSFSLLLNELSTSTHGELSWQLAASEARADEQFPAIRIQQWEHLMYREEGCWLLNSSPEEACAWGRRFKQDAIVYAEAGQMAQLLSCGKASVSQ